MLVERELQARIRGVLHLLHRQVLLGAGGGVNVACDARARELDVDVRRRVDKRAGLQCLGQRVVDLLGHADPGVRARGQRRRDELSDLGRELIADAFAVDRIDVYGTAFEVRIVGCAASTAA